MENGIIKQPDFTLDRAALDPDDYVTTLFAEGRRIGIASDDDAQRFMSGVAKLLAEAITVQSGGESTSVREETAAKMVESIMYCVSVGLLLKPTPEIALEYLLAEQTETVYCDGLYQLRNLQKRADLIRLLLLKTKQPDRSEDYYKFTDITVPRYLEAYDPKISANEGVFVRLPELGLIKNVRGLYNFYKVMTDLLSYNRGDPPCNSPRADVK